MRRIFLVTLVLITALVIHWLSNSPIAAGPDILIFTVDEINHADLRFSQDQATPTPTLHELASRSLYFRNCAVESSSTLTTHATLWTGLSQSIHGVRGPQQRLSSRIGHLAQDLHQAGYRTASFLSSPLLDRTFGLDRGFERYQNACPLSSTAAEPFDPGVSKAPVPRNPAHETFLSARSWMQQLAPRDRFLLHLHLSPGRHPERGKLGLKSWLEQVDRTVAAMLEELHHLGRAEDTLVVVVGTNGRHPKGEDLANFLGSTSVPFLLFDPHAAQGIVRDDAVGTLDVTPTLLARLQMPRVLPGRNLLGSSQAPPLVLSSTSTDRIMIRQASWGFLYPSGGPIESVCRWNSVLGAFERDSSIAPHLSEDLLQKAKLRRQELAIFREEHYPGLDATHPDLGDRLRTLRSIGYLR